MLLYLKICIYHINSCFLQFWAQIGGLLIPMSVILLINIVIFILVVRQLLRSANISGRVKRDATVERRETIERVQNAICILLLLGLTWVTGYLLLIPAFSKVGCSQIAWYINPVHIYIFWQVSILRTWKWKNILDNENIGRQYNYLESIT